MEIFKSRSRLLFIGVGLLLVLLASLGAWVVTTPEFWSVQEKTYVGRLMGALDARLSSMGFKVGRLGTKKSKSSVKSAGKATTPTGTGSVLVVDSRNKPIPDVHVTFRSAEGAVKEKTGRSGRVDAKLPPGTYLVTLTHSRYSTEVRSHQQVYGPRRGFSINVQMQTNVTVRGRVVDEEGKPVQGATVSGERNWLQQFSATGGVFLDDAAYPTVATDAKGQFKLAEVSIGSNTFNANMRGYAPAEARAEVPAAGLASELKLVLKRPATISGRVLNEDTQPVSGVRVTAISYQPYGGSVATLPPSGFTASTGADGSFQLKKLFAEGYYHLRFENSAYAVTEQAQVSAGTTGMNVILERGGEISGNVQYIDRETTPAFVMLNATAVIAGTTITRSVMSEPTGTFKFERLAYGAYELSVNYKGFVNEPRSRVASLKNRPSTGTLVEVYQATGLSGKVIDAFSGDSIPSAQVTVRSTYGVGRERVRRSSIKASSTGTFMFDKLPGGIHVVTAQAEGYLPSSGSGADYSFAVSPGAQQKDVSIFLSKGGVLRGQVVDQDGTGIGEAETQLYVASGSFSGLSVKDLNQTTDGSGFFEFRGFPIGQGVSLYVSARKPGYAKKHSDLVELWPAQPEGATEVVMTPGGVVTGRVTDKQNRPVYGVKVTIDSREFPADPSPGEFFTFTDNDGNYLLEHCSPGRAILVADHDDYVRKTRSATVPEGRLLSRQNFVMERSRNIYGTVADFYGNPIADATVSAAPLTKTEGSGRDKTDKKGDFEIKGLGEGKFRLEASFTLDTADGKQAYVFIVPEVSAGATGVPIDCDLRPGATGSILGESGRGIDTFKLTLRSRADTEPKQLFRFNLTRSVTKAGGVLRLLNVPRGIYNMKIEAPGYETWENTEVVIGPGNRTRLPTIRMKPASQIIGKIVSSTTGKAVQGALVRVLDDSRKEVETVNRIDLAAYKRSDILEYLDAAYDEDYKYDPDPMTRLVARVRANVVTTLQTNVYGNFDINDLADGQYTLEIEHPGFRPKRIRNVHVGRKSVADLGTIELEPGGTVKGRVVDIEGNGISNAGVQVKGELQGRNRARTDVGGNFVMRGIGFGEWPVVVQATVQNRKVYAWKRISVRPDETSLVEFVLDVSASVSGRVIFPGASIKSGNVRLYALDEDGAILGDYVYSDTLTNGRYNISAIPSGRYFSVVSGSASNGSFAAWQWIDLPRGKKTVDFEGMTASLRGVIRNVVTGEPVPRARVESAVDVTGAVVPAAVLKQLRLSATADAAGRFSFLHLQPGIHRIFAGAPGQAIIPVDAVSILPNQAVRNYRVDVQVAP